MTSREQFQESKQCKQMVMIVFNSFYTVDKESALYYIQKKLSSTTYPYIIINKQQRDKKDHLKKTYWYILSRQSKMTLI